MRRVYRAFGIVGVEGSAGVRALFDTGACRTFVHEKPAMEIGYLRFPRGQGSSNGG